MRRGTGNRGGVYEVDISLDVRRGDSARERVIEDVMEHREADIQAILDEYGVPVVRRAARRR